MDPGGLGFEMRHQVLAMDTNTIGLAAQTLVGVHSWVMGLNGPMIILPHICVGAGIVLVCQFVQFEGYLLFFTFLFLSFRCSFVFVSLPSRSLPYSAALNFQLSFSSLRPAVHQTGPACQLTVSRCSLLQQRSQQPRHARTAFVIQLHRRALGARPSVPGAGRMWRQPGHSPTFMAIVAGM